MATFDGETEFQTFRKPFSNKFEGLTTLFRTEIIQYFRFLLRGDAFEFFCNMTEAIKTDPYDIIAGSCRRYVKIQSVATARCRWESLNFDPMSPTVQDFLERYQKLAQGAYAGDAPKYIGTSFYVKTPVLKKTVLDQAHRENASYKMMVYHLERKMELNGPVAPHTTSFTGIKNIEHAPNPSQERTQMVTGPYFGCGHPGHLLRSCRKISRCGRTKTPS